MTAIRVPRSRVCQFNTTSNDPAVVVEPGTVVQVETELASGDWLHTPADTWDPTKTSANNPCNVIAISNARPGDTLAVSVLAIEPDSIGYLAIETKDAVHPDLARRLYGEVFSRTVTIADGHAQLTPTLAVPLRPLIGTLGTTTPYGEISNVLAGRYGGNMDVQEVAPGATVRLPVFVDRALLNVGDVHARQSDTELSAIETRATVHLRIDLERPTWPLPGPRIQDDTHLTTVAFADDLKQASEQALTHLIDWISTDYPLTPQDAYLLVGACGEARATRLLEPGNYPYVWKIARHLLPDPRPDTSTGDPRPAEPR